jgi:tetratricopeptide (TPR) repeat protein
MRTMKSMIGALLCGGLLMAQTADVKQPQLKSQKEQEAVMAIFNSPDPAGRIKAVDELLAKFADTTFKNTALYVATDSADQLGDWEKTVIYGERTLEADPKSYGAMLLLARGYATKTKEFDFDKEEKLGKADKYAKDALELLKNAPKIQPQIPDDQWAAQVKSWTGDAYEALGLSATVRKKYDDAIALFQKGVEAAPANGTLMARLADAQVSAKKYDDAIATVAKLNAIPDVNPQIKSYADGVKKRAEAGKAQK